MNLASPIVDENTTEYDDTNISSPILSDSQVNLLVNDLITSKTPVAAVTDDISCVQTPHSSLLLNPSSEILISDNLPSIFSEQNDNTVSGVDHTEQNHSSNSDELHSLEEPLSLAREDLPIPSTLSTLERNLAQAQLEQSRLSELYSPISDYSTQPAADFKQITSFVECYLSDPQDECFKALGTIHPLLEDRPMTGTVPNSTVYDLLKNRALSIFSFAPLQATTASFTAHEMKPSSSDSTTVLTDNRPPELTRSATSSNSLLEGTDKASVPVEPSELVQITSATSKPLEVIHNTSEQAPYTTSVYDENLERAIKGMQHLQLPQTYAFRSRMMTQSMTTNASSDSPVREISLHVTRSASTSPMVARKIYLNRITGGALWTFQRPAITMSHSTSYNGIFLETESWTDDDRSVWGIGSSQLSLRKPCDDYENMENWPWPLKKVMHSVDSSPKGRRRLPQSNMTTSIEMSPNRTRLLSSAESRVPTTPVPQPSISMLPEDQVMLLQAVKNSTSQWYCPDISLAEVRKRLERQPAGSFIVRRSNRQHNHYHLAVITENGEVQLVTLELTPSGYMIKGFNKVRYYPTMSHLVAAHCCQSSPLPCLLRLPGYASFSGSGRLKPPTANLMGSTSLSLRNRLPPPLVLPVNGTRGPMGDYSPGTQPSRSWTELMGPREMSDSWTEKVSVPPVPPHRTPNSCEQTRKQSQRPLYSLLPQGAACQLFYLGGFEVLGKQWAQAIQLCTDHVLGPGRNVVQLTRVNFRVNETGITVTDLERKLFTQRHFPTACILYIGLDPFDRRWKSLELYNEGIIESKIFGFVAISQSNAIAGPQCHLFCEYDLNESANVICDFTNRYLDIVDV